MHETGLYRLGSRFVGCSPLALALELVYLCLPTRRVLRVSLSLHSAPIWPWAVTN